jgi:small subunit ribosomal protein S6
LRTYEALYIVRPDVTDDEVQTVAKEVETMVTDNGGAIVRSEIWGKRRLAYEVQKFSEGCYILVRFTAAPVFVARLENHFRLTDAIIRYLVVHFDENMLNLEALQKKRKEAEIRNSIAATPRDEDDDDDRPSPRRGRRFNDDDDDDE